MEYMVSSISVSLSTSAVSVSKYTYMYIYAYGNYEWLFRNFPDLSLRLLLIKH